jgi:hypothetical protein
MSIELHVYSQEPVLHRERLATECLWPELPVKLQWEVRFLSETGALHTAGPLAEGLVLGWHPGSPHGLQIEEALARKHESRLDKLSSKNMVGSLYLSVIKPDDQEEWEDIIDSVKEDVEDSIHRKYLRNVRTFYSLETSATRNDLSLEFQEQLWRMIGVLTHGLMYDPQEGKFDLFQE